MVNTLKWQLAVQYADVRPDQPGAWSTLDAEQSTATERCASGISLSYASRFYVRFGVAYRSGTNGTQASADLSLRVTFNSCGQVLGAGAQRLTAVSTTEGFWPVTGWMPSVAAAKVKAAFSGSAFVGTGFRYQLAQQKAATSVESPGAWAAIEAGWRTNDGAGNTGELTLSYSSQAWTRFGVAYSVSSGSYGQGDVAVAIAVRAL